MIILHRLFELPIVPLVAWLLSVAGLAWLRRRNARAWAEAAAITSVRHLTGGEAALEMLEAAGLDAVGVTDATRAPIDYYDPIALDLRLSPATRDASTLAALSLVAHEAGHAVQAAQRTAPQRLRLRDRLATAARLAPLTGALFFATGFVLDLHDLQSAGLLVLPAAVAAVGLGIPLERDASRRGRRLLAMCALVNTPQAPLVERTLEAATWREVEAIRLWPSRWGRNRLSLAAAPR